MDNIANYGSYDDGEKSENGVEELLVFGYSCKLFRDDEKAKYIESGEHLIPWMGDTNLLIDRFDVRGALYDLHVFDHNNVSAAELTEAELKTEQLCEQERYFALYHDELHYQTLQDEEKKRLNVEMNSSYNQIGMNYSALEEQNQASENQKQAAESASYTPSVDDETFIPFEALNIPHGMQVPQTVKQHKIILKTAKFVATQGAQMEIVIKTKQGANPMFKFLSFDNPLNAYYKHVVTMIRNGKLKPEEEAPAPPTEQNDQNVQSDFSKSLKPDLTPDVVSAPVQPSPNCPYTKLTSKIRGSRILPLINEQEPSTVSQESSSNNASTTSKTVATIPPATPTLLVTSTSILTAPTQIVSSSPRATLTPPLVTTPSVPVATTAPAPAPASVVKEGSIVSAGKRYTGLVDYPSFGNAADDSEDGGETSETSEVAEQEPIVKPKPKIFDYRDAAWPPRDLQMVIDKMASYIIKNGPGFEDVVKSRRDPRMSFLEEQHEFYPYYRCKIQLYNEVYGDVFSNPSKLQDWCKKRQSAPNMSNTFGGRGGVTSSAKTNGACPRAISFSIRSREQEPAVTTHTTFPVESSTSEEDEDMSDGERARRQAARIKRRAERKKKLEIEKKEREEYLKKERLKKEEETKKTRKKHFEDKEDSASSSGNEDLYDIFKYAKDMEGQKNTLTENNEDNEGDDSLKLKKRKEKAAKFLSNLKEKSGGKPIYGPQLPPELMENSHEVPSGSCGSSGSASARSATPPKVALTPPQATVTPPQEGTPPHPSILEFLATVKNDPSEEVVESPLEDVPEVAESFSPEPQAEEENGDIPNAEPNFVVEEEGEIVSDDKDSNDIRVRSSHKRHKKDPSVSPTPRRSSRKKKKKHVDHKRKRKRSRSRSTSRHRNKSHRSRKKKSKSHSRRSKVKSKRKQKRRRRSSSLSSFPSSDSEASSRDEATDPSTIPPSDSENSDMDVQVIESDEVKRSTRESSVISLPPVGDVKATLSKAPSTKEGTPETESRGSTSLRASPFVSKSTNAVLAAAENSNSSEGASQADLDKKAPFNLSNSSAMAKITQGLRAKLNALLEKDSNIS